MGAAVQFNGDGDSRTDGDKSYPYQLAAVYEVDALELAFAVDSNDGAGDNENTYGLRASYNLDNLRLQALHNLSDNMYIYAEGYIGGGDDVYDYNYERVDSDDFDDTVGVSDERTVAAVGAVYYF